MSEVEPNSPPGFVRRLPEAVANDELNRIIRSALNEALAAEDRDDYATAREYGEAVAEEFYQLLGTGAIAAELEERAEELPSRYLGETDVYVTALQYVDRVDYQTYAHPAILSPLMALMGRDGGPYYVGTDKMAHFVQQSYDYYFIYRTVEENRPGLGELYAKCWGLWGEGIELTDDYVREYLESHNLPSDSETVSRIREEITTFMEDSDTVTYLSPAPEFVKSWVIFRWLAQELIDVHRFGIYGIETTGVISYSDLAVNDAGLQFYFNLIADPEAMARNFDITDYITPEWDEEILPSTFSPVIQERIEEARGNGIKWPFVYGIGAQISGPPWSFGLSIPILYHTWRDTEWRLRLGASMPFDFDESVLASESRGFASVDMSMRISGLYRAYITADFGLSEDGFHPLIGSGLEIAFLGWTTIGVGFTFDIIDYNTSFIINILRIAR